MNDTRERANEALRRYLLDAVSAEERATVEQRLMTDQGFLDALSQAEEELIDEYARKELDARDKERFESLFLNVPERREKVAFAQALDRYIAALVPRPEPASGSRWRGALIACMAAAMVMLAFTSAFFYWETGNLRRQLVNSEQARASATNAEETTSVHLAEQQKHNQELEQQLADARSHTPPATLDVAALTLTSGWNRSGEPTPVARLMTPLIERLRLTLVLAPSAPDYNKYRIVVQTLEGKRVWTGSKAARRSQPRTTSLSVTVPESVLAAGDYLVVLNGITPDGNSEEAATYYFRVARK